MESIKRKHIDEHGFDQLKMEASFRSRLEIVDEKVVYESKEKQIVEVDTMVHSEMQNILRVGRGIKQVHDQIIDGHTVSEINGGWLNAEQIAGLSNQDLDRFYAATTTPQELEKLLDLHKRKLFVYKSEENTVTVAVPYVSKVKLSNGRFATKRMKPKHFHVKTTPVRERFVGLLNQKWLKENEKQLKRLLGMVEREDSEPPVSFIEGNELMEAVRHVLKNTLFHCYIRFSWAVTYTDNPEIISKSRYGGRMTITVFSLFYDISTFNSNEEEANKIRVKQSRLSVVASPDLIKFRAKRYEMAFEKVFWSWYALAGDYAGDTDEDEGSATQKNFEVQIGILSHLFCICFNQRRVIYYRCKELLMTLLDNASLFLGRRERNNDLFTMAEKVSLETKRAKQSFSATAISLAVLGYALANERDRLHVSGESASTAIVDDSTVAKYAIKPRPLPEKYNVFGLGVAHLSVAKRMHLFAFYYPAKALNRPLIDREVSVLDKILTERKGYEIVPTPRLSDYPDHSSCPCPTDSWMRRGIILRDFLPAGRKMLKIHSALEVFEAVNALKVAAIEKQRRMAAVKS